eukprot:CAMPEP_0176270678 /NCGR_PEP_ID=MMETSP0121_2-20121125/44821_1 /TAXON_ID=160619 /ORGANISM="Kryptoperidinium foliaceum, Strain CCMP 1326" /LENGTH=118 /DNA_ID=CAMNT_0017610825 /DNA_START=50 /DNA_END=406 /DNA_ORIENTATION=-
MKPSSIPSPTIALSACLALAVVYDLSLMARSPPTCGLHFTESAVDPAVTMERRVQRARLQQAMTRAADEAEAAFQESHANRQQQLHDAACIDRLKQADMNVATLANSLPSLIAPAQDD